MNINTAYNCAYYLANHNRYEVTSVSSANTSQEEISGIFPEQTPRDQNSTPQHYSVEVLNTDELLLALSTDVLSHPAERLQKLKSLCTFISSNGEKNNPYWNLWLEVPHQGKTTYMNIVMEQKAYDSQCFPEYIVNQDPLTRLDYHYIRAAVDGDDKNYYFEMRLDPSFESGEILHIKQAADLSGTEIKKLCMLIMDFIKPNYIYLHDDAKIYNEDESTLALRIFLPLVSDQPKTWYTPNGFCLATYEQLENYEGEPRVPQNADIYNSAVYTARNTFVNELFQNSPACSDYKKSILVSWIQTYVKAIDRKKTLANCTLHDLAKGIYLASRSATDRQFSQPSAQDFKLFYRLYCHAHPYFPKSYQTAINVLENYQLWFKTS